MPDGVKLAFVQPDEDLGVTIFRNMNDDNRNGVLDSGDILDKVTTFASLNGDAVGDGSTLVQLLNDQGRTYMAYALPSNASDTSVDLVATGELTLAGRGLKPWAQVDIADFGMIAGDRLTVDTGNLASLLEFYQDITHTLNHGGTPWFDTPDGRTITILEGDFWVTYNAEKVELSRVDTPFDHLGTPESLQYFYDNNFQIPQLEYVMFAAGAVIQGILDYKTSLGASVDLASLGLDITGLNAGTITIGGNEFFGVKDYTEAPITGGEILNYVSWLASQTAADPDFWQQIGVDALSPDPEVAAKAARLYVSNNTPMEEFWANKELPTNVSFDAFAYLTANPDLIDQMNSDPNLDFDVPEVMARFAANTMIASDSANVLKLLQMATIQYISSAVKGEGNYFAAYESDLNGDSNTDIIRVSDDGIATATISTEGEDSETPQVADFVMQDGNFLGLRQDVDGDGVADTIVAPDADGGIWNVTLSSTGATGSARTSSAAQLLAGANADLQPGGDGILIDLNGDGVDDLSRVLQANQDTAVTTAIRESDQYKDLVTLATGSISGEGGGVILAQQWTVETLPGYSDNLVQAIEAFKEAQNKFEQDRLAIVADVPFNPVLIDQLWLDFNAGPAKDLLNAFNLELDGGALITLGVADETAPDGFVLSTDPEDTFIGETMQDAVANLNAVQLLAWTAGNKELILAFGDNVTAALVGFARVGSYSNALNLGDFADKNQTLLAENDGDLVAALRSYITTKREAIYTDLIGLDTRQRDGLQEVISQLTSLYIGLADGDTFTEQNWLEIRDLSVTYQALLVKLNNEIGSNDLVSDLGITLTSAALGALSDTIDTLTQQLDNAANTNIYNSLLAKIPEELNLLQVISGFRLENQRLEASIVDRNGYLEGDLNFVFDVNMLIGANMEDRVGTMTEIMAANGQTVFSLEDAVESIELETSLAKTNGFEIGTQDDDTFNGADDVSNKYFGAAGDDEIYGGDARDELLGSLGDDYIVGNAGDDLLVGGAGADVIVGGDGDDVLIGGAGDDFLQGSNGADLFVFTGGDGEDRITDFNSVIGDRIIIDVAGINSFDDLLAVSSQQNGNAVFNFGNGDSLILRNVSVTALSSSAFDFGADAVESAIQTFRSANTAPVVLTPDQTTNFVFLEDEVINFSLPQGSVFDPDGDELTITAELASGSDNQLWLEYLASGATGMPDWLGFSPETLTFSGRPPKDFNGTIEIRLTASDGRLDAFDTFTLEITPVDDDATAVDDSGYSKGAGIPIIITAAELLANDLSGDSGSISLVSVQNAPDGRARWYCVAERGRGRGL